jgi:hypothetical protein
MANKPTARAPHKELLGDLATVLRKHEPTLRALFHKHAPAIRKAMQQKRGQQ